VVYGIVKEHKGEIKVYSEIGRGTTFNVYLPLMKRAQSALPAAIEQEIPTGRERILLVEDEMAVARLEVQMLERLGYRVTLRLDSIEALNAFEATPEAYDLVMTDMTMPRMTGDQLAKALIAIRPDIPVIICTGFSERIDADKAAAMGIKGFVMKPVLRADMAQTLRKVLDKKC
jgi:CheY-like chemotaxis protein